MLGGRKSAQASGLRINNRDEIFARITAFGEGNLFRIQDIVREDTDLTDDFRALKGFDYIHVADGYCAGIVETRYLRQLPKVSLLLASYESLRNLTLVETGDWVGWRNSIKQWEPILGIRRYTEGADEILSYGHAPIRILNAPDWLRAEDDTSRLLRVFIDTPSKELEEALTRARKVTHINDTDLRNVVNLARSLGSLREEEKERWPWLRCPLHIADTIDEWIKRTQADRKQ